MTEPHAIRREEDSGTIKLLFGYDDVADNAYGHLTDAVWNECKTRLPEEKCYNVKSALQEMCMNLHLHTLPEVAPYAHIAVMIHKDSGKVTLCHTGYASADQARRMKQKYDAIHVFDQDKARAELRRRFMREEYDNHLSADGETKTAGNGLLVMRASSEGNIKLTIDESPKQTLTIGDKQFYPFELNMESCVSRYKVSDVHGAGMLEELGSGSDIQLKRA